MSWLRLALAVAVLALIAVVLWRAPIIEHKHDVVVHIHDTAHAHTAYSAVSHAHTINGTPPVDVTEIKMRLGALGEAFEILDQTVTTLQGCIPPVSILTGTRCGESP